MRYKHIVSIVSIMIILVGGTSIYAKELTILTEEYPPINFRQGDSLTGSSVEIVREILKRLHQPAEITMLPWARAYNLAKTKPNMVLFTTTRTQERENLFHWVGPVCTSTNAFYAKKGSNLQIDSLEDAKKVHAIACYKDDAREQMLTSWGFKNLDSSNSPSSNLKKLLSGRVDLWVYDTLGLPAVTKQLGVDISELELVYAINWASLYIAISKGTSETLVKKWQDTLDCMKLDGIFHSISRKWLPESCIPKSHPAISPDKCKSSELNIYTENSPPGNYLDKGELTGFAVEVVREILRRSGRIENIQVVPWARGYNMTLTNPNVALFSTTRLPQREKIFKWVGPLYRQTWGFYAKNGSGIILNSLDDAKKIARIGTYHKDAKEQFLQKKGFKNLVSTNTNISNIKHLIQGSVDLWVSSDFNMPYLARQAGILPNSLELVYAFREVDNYIAFSMQTPDATMGEWQDILDAIKKDGTYAKLYDKYVDFKRFDYGP
jgi:polar amino acid transport system substrate-binding protein